MPGQTRTPTSQSERLVFGDEAVQLLARQLQNLALMDPVEVLARVTEGEDTLLPKFRASTPDASKLRRWTSIQRASPQPLSSSDYWASLQGEFGFPERAMPAVDQVYLSREVIPFLRDSWRDVLVTGTTAVVSVIVSALAAFSVIGTGWLAIIAAVYGLTVGAETIFMGSRMRSLEKETKKLTQMHSRAPRMTTE